MTIQEHGDALLTAYANKDFERVKELWCEVARDATDPDKVCEELVKQTLDGGAPDNVTVVVVKFMDDGSDNGSNQ